MDRRWWWCWQKEIEEGFWKKSFVRIRKKVSLLFFRFPGGLAGWWWQGGEAVQDMYAHFTSVLYSISSKTLANNKLACYYTYYICTSTYFPREKNEVFKLIFSFLFCGEKVGSTSSKTKCTTCYITRMQVTCISLSIHYFTW